MKNQTLLLLPGALGSSKDFTHWMPLLEKQFRIETFDYPGHNGKIANQPFSIQYFANAVNDFLHSISTNNIHVFGFSMGGYIALYLETLHPKTFKSIVTLGTKYNWTKEFAEKEILNLNPQKMEEKVPAFVNHLEKMHGASWKEVVEGTADLMISLGQQPLLNKENLIKIETQTTICLGELDNMVSKIEAQEMAGMIPNSEFKLLLNMIAFVS